MRSCTQSNESILLLFGPQIPRLVPTRLEELRKGIANDPRLDFLIRIIKDVPSFWTDIVDQNCLGLERLAGTRQQLEHLRAFFENETAELVAGPSPHNVLLVPITVITQIADYVHLGRSGCAQGFCVGFLAAAAVSCAQDIGELERWTATALRLAILVGAVIDLDEQKYMRDPSHTSGQSSTWTIRWKSYTEKEHLQESLSSFPEAYISCETDVDRATFTIFEHDLAALLEQLAEGGLYPQSVGIRGRYHTANLGRKDMVELLRALCRDRADLQFPAVEQLGLSLRSTADANIITNGRLHDIAIDCILIHVCRWYETVKEALGAINGQPADLIPVGDSRGSVPRSLKQGAPDRSSSASNGASTTSNTAEKPDYSHDKANYIPNGVLPSTPLTPESPATPRPDGSNNPIAVIGMACRYAQADSVHQFWQLINSGGNAVSLVPEDRFRSQDLWRSPKGPFWGNFLSEPQAFDHRFFHVSAREAASMDPQQRLLLQVAYEAMESAGYPEGSELPNRPIGCYVGAGYVEYEDNVASENATAFSATGTIRAFISGRVSHYFGWTGPSMVFDTACSSSAVAIHQACNALQANECSIAVAGGVSMMTSATFYQNLAAASFLSPTGASRAFDAQANGYCRGEGAGMLVLKPLAQAVADNDHILGTIVGSAVNQNSSASPITVPDSGSQSDLYLRAVAKAGASPSDVSYVEAHGTGTPVGDPIECASIRTAFGGSHRSQELLIGSVKDVIGHTEAASGVAGVIKTLLMMHHGIIPKQPNFDRLNPKIPALELDKMAIATQTRAWHESTRRMALVNNYGAAGSNAAILLQDYRADIPNGHTETPTLGHQTKEYPILVSAKTPESLRAYCVSLGEYLDRVSSITLGDVAYNLARRRNRSLESTAYWTSSSLATLRQDLRAFATGSRPIVQRGDDKRSNVSAALSATAPVVLCFGGQSGRSAHLSQELVHGSSLLRKQLERCDEACKVLGLESLFPRIFDPTPIDDLVSLHVMLFSLQFASSMSWIEAGLEVSCVIGHSFGQLTAMSVAGCMDLEDGLRLVTERARLMKVHWGADPGAMMAIEGDPESLKFLLGTLSEIADADVACYNGPRNIVLAGSTEAMDVAEPVCRTTSGIKSIRLANSHAYHSRLCDPILEGLRRVAKTISLRTPSIPVETCTAYHTSVFEDAEILVQHTRQPVYFGEAVQRITNRYRSCVWLEAGSASPIIGMVRRALPTTRQNDSDILLPLDLGRSKSWSNLAQATSALWAAGSSVNFWPFSGSQAQQHRWMDLPPYQFVKTNHWIRWQPSRSQVEVEVPVSPIGPSELVQKITHEPDRAEFAINVSHEFFNLSVSGHAVVGQPLCPAGLYFELAIRAANLLQEVDAGKTSRIPRIEQLRIMSPLGLKPHGALFVALTRDDDKQTGSMSRYDFTFFSCAADARSLPDPSSHRTAHAEGTVSLLEPHNASSRLEFMGRLLHKSCYDRVASSANANRLSGDVLYKIFDRVVSYAPYYKGLRNAVASEGEAVGDATMPSGPAADRLASGVSDPLAIDSFLQLGGIHINFLHADCHDEDVYVCNAIGEVLWSEEYLKSNSRMHSLKVRGPRTWRLFSNMQVRSKSMAVHHIFVLDASTNAVVLAILGAEFAKVPLASLRRLLAKVNGETASSPSQVRGTSGVQKTNDVHEDVAGSQILPGLVTNRTVPREDLPGIGPPSLAKQDSGAHNVEVGDGLQGIRQMLSEVLGISTSEIQSESSLADMGVDSLMITEISTEVKKRFNVTLSVDDLRDLTDVQSLSQSLGGLSSSSKNAPVPPNDKASSSTSGIERPAIVQNGTKSENEATSTPPHTEEDSGGLVEIASEWMATRRNTFDADVKKSEFTRFCDDVYPDQKKLVVAYTVEALADLGCDLRTLRPGEHLPTPRYLVKHENLMTQMYRILENAGLVNLRGPDVALTNMPVPLTLAQDLHEAIVHKFPQHAAEHELLRTTGARLADCLSGKAEALSLMFGDAKARRLMEEVYTNGPMFQAATSFLSRFLVDTCERSQGQRAIRILELGAGTGGTTSHLVKQLEKNGAAHIVQYTFSDISGSLVAMARKKFAAYPFMDYAVVNVEKEPVASLRGRYDVIISTNCIHATPDLVHSCSNIQLMLRKSGILCLVEHTQNLFWFDLVWGLVEGWWLFNDGRTHALASKTKWKESLQASGFSWIDWSGGKSEESKILRVITASPSSPSSKTAIEGGAVEMDTLETVVFKNAGPLALEADIYYPPTLQTSNKRQPIALMIHGGGHVTLSRKDIRPKQTHMLLDAGFVPVSVDFRLCPEMTLLEGPMTDVRDALSWARRTLPFLSRKRSDVRIDGDRVVAVGWSTGGHLALSLGWTSPSVGLEPPQAILAFYCPYDYEDECWSRPNKPFGDLALTEDAYDLWDGVADSPMVAYSLPPRSAGGWMAKSDARSRIILHMNWYGQTLPILIHGLKDKSSRQRSSTVTQQLPPPTLEEIRAISPLAQVRQGNYHVPTFIVHPVDDDLIPWQQAQRTADEMMRTGIDTELRIVQNAIHLFDMYPNHQTNGEAVRAISDAYDFLSRHAAADTRSFGTL